MGKTLYAKKERHEEHAAFFDWLLATIREKRIDLLLVAGDVFDTSAPSTANQRMYYGFLMRVRAAGCANVVVVGGNHDSPSFLNAPKDILAALDVRVVGNAGEDMADEIIVVNDASGAPGLIVCGVPFLRERDISRFAEGESYADRSKRINDNIRKHYEAVAALAEEKRGLLGKAVPIVATGHLSVAGGKRNDDDGVRETYIGNIEAVGSDIFPDLFDYVALGHYHIPSAIKDHVRYCGSPVPMGFGEAGQKKCVYVVDLTEGRQIETVEIPVFQQLASIEGDKAAIEKRLRELKSLDRSVWTEILYTGGDIFPDFPAWAAQQTAGSQ